MTYQYLNFRFPDEATQHSVMPLGTFKNMDIIGFPMKPTGQNDANGDPIYAADTSYWLVNVALRDDETLTDAQKGYQIAPPAQPHRVWAGQ